VTPPGPDPAALIAWILRHATAEDDGGALLEGICRGLNDAGLPLWRMSLATPTIDPNHRAVATSWRRDVGMSVLATAHGAEAEAVFRRSPVGRLMDENRTAARWNLEIGEGCDDLLLLGELRAEGGTDYRLDLVGFSAGTAMLGAAISFATDRPGGFTAPDMAVIDRLLPALGLAAYRLNLSRTVRDVLGAYLGPMTAARVLAGEIRRGRGEVLSAAILLADLRSFTSLTDHEDPVRVVGWLDDHLETLGAAVDRHGGEILKFTGDGFIAVFPVGDQAAHPCPVCVRALAAAQGALTGNQGLNVRRRQAGEPELAVDLVLHFGDVVYGNVGTSHRLDFTTIGRAVNEASRIEALCDGLGRHLLLSDSFAGRCGRGFSDLGLFPLRGVGAPQRVWTV
jgi:adenylate cyclase